MVRSGCSVPIEKRETFVDLAHKWRAIATSQKPYVRSKVDSSRDYEHNCPTAWTCVFFCVQ